MKKPMKLTIDDLAQVVAECEEKGVSFMWYMQPIKKNPDDSPESGKDSEQEGSGDDEQGD